MMNRLIAVVAMLATLAAGVAAQDVFDKKQIRETMTRVAKWQLANPKHETNDWTNGAFYAGVFAAYRTTKDPFLLDSMTKAFDAIAWAPGRRFDHADDIAVTQTYIDIYRIKKDRKMIQPSIDAIARIGVDESAEVKKHGILWWWCDALFMAPPTFAKLGRTLGDKSYYAKSDKYFDETYKLLFDHEEHLFARDESYLIDASGKGKREANLRKIFWSRGNGWVLGGLARLLDELPRDYPRRKFYEQLFKEMSARVLQLQQPDGLWRASLLDPASFPGGEASGSGFYAYSFAWGVNNGLLDRKTYGPAAKKAWTALNTLVHPDGKVGWTQPIGADPRKNFDKDSWEVYGAGAFLLAGSEIIKMK